MKDSMFAKKLTAKCTAEEAAILQGNINKHTMLKGHCVLIESVEPDPEATDGTHIVTIRPLRRMSTEN